MLLKKLFLQGNQACVKGAIAAGCRFYAGYPITPSSEIMEAMAIELPKVGGVFIQMEDEIASLAAVIGAVWTGAKGMTATSGPGASLMQEHISYALMTETPCVVVNVQRAGPSTGQATKPASSDLMQARWGAHGDYEIIVLAPWSVQEMYTLTVRAFNLAETYRVPVILLADEAIGHLSEKVDLPTDKTDPVRSKTPKAFALASGQVTSNGAGLPPFGYPITDAAHKDQPTLLPCFGQGHKLLVTGSTHDEFGYRQTQSAEVQARLIARLCNKIRSNVDKITEYETYPAHSPSQVSAGQVQPMCGAETLLVSYGFTARSSLQAMKLARAKGKKVGLLRLKTIWPFPEKAFQNLDKRIKRIIVPEMNQGQLIREIQRFVDCEVVPFNKTNGEVITPKEILNCLAS